MKVLLDMDGVIANFYAGFAGHLNDTHNAGLDLEQEPSEYSLHKWGHNIPDDVVNAEIPKWMIKGGYRDMPIYPGAIQFVMQLMDRYDVYIVTARVGDFRMNFPEKVIDIIKADTVKWLQRHGIPSDKLFFEHKKIDFCKKNGIESIIEDKLSTVVDAAKAGMNAILINRGWNQEGEAWYGEELSRDHEGIFVANSYDDVLSYLKEVEG